MIFPDKLTYKTTVTSLLRSQIASAVTDYSLLGKTYLEIGCDKGYTMFEVSQAFDVLVGIDIDQWRVSAAKSLLKTLDNQHKFSFITGTSQDIPVASYDVVLIDAAHDYKNVEADFQNVLAKNTAKKYAVFFHDYGLVASGVKQFVNDRFGHSFEKKGMPTGWNPLGSQVDDWEAVCHVVKSP